MDYDNLMASGEEEVIAKAEIEPNSNLNQILSSAATDVTSSFGFTPPPTPQSFNVFEPKKEVFKPNPFEIVIPKAQIQLEPNVQRYAAEIEELDIFDNATAQGFDVL